MNSIPVVDIFAGCGGLGEGFNQACGGAGFDVRLSIEMDTDACASLRLRKFFNLADGNSRATKDYYRYIEGVLDIDQLFGQHPQIAEIANRYVWQQALGEAGFTEKELDKRISSAIAGSSTWVLVGGPPCQAYSSAGRARNLGKADYDPKEDRRHFLYKEYLRIIGRHWPSVFVMENVPGILTSKAGGTERIFPKILNDLSDPHKATEFNHRRDDANRRYLYKIKPLRSEAKIQEDLFGDRAFEKDSDFVVKSEQYGVPQARHRVILVGVRDDIDAGRPKIKTFNSKQETVSSVLDGLPRLCSGVSSKSSQRRSGPTDEAKEWFDAVVSAKNKRWVKQLDKIGQGDVGILINKILDSLRMPQKGRGAERLFYRKSGKAKGNQLQSMNRDLYRFVKDGRVGNLCNSVTRSHMVEDLYRYLYVSAFGKVRGKSPVLKDFPKALLPDHKNVKSEANLNTFADRFRVLVADEPSSTIVSHLSKDGHAFIHPDPSQCRSITVREAARIQTFPDNYFFFGNRGSQFKQVGNAVPPYLAKTIAEAVASTLSESEKVKRKTRKVRAKKCGKSKVSKNYDTA